MLPDDPEQRDIGARLYLIVLSVHFERNHRYLLGRNPYFLTLFLRPSFPPRIRYWVNSSGNPVYTLGPDFHREPWIPDQVRNDKQSKGTFGAIQSSARGHQR